jgi:hypothetical protein
MILDSGERIEFESGAVRDIVKGKGRTELVPWDAYIQHCQVAGCYKGGVHYPTTIQTLYDIMRGVADPATAMFVALGSWCFCAYDGDWETMLLDVSIHYEEGAEKYSAHNWAKGIPLCRYMNSTLRHLMKWARNDDDESHVRAVTWNMLGFLYTATYFPNLVDEFEESALFPKVTKGE